MRAIHESAVADHIGLANLAYRYFAAIDTTLDIDAVLDCITADGELDYRDLGVALFRGHDEIRGFFEAVFAGAVWQIHYLTNFHVTAIDGDSAQALGYLFAKACRKGTAPFETYGACAFAFRREDAGWMIRHLREYPLAPGSGEIPGDFAASGPS